MEVVLAEGKDSSVIFLLVFFFLVFFGHDTIWKNDFYAGIRPTPPSNATVTKNHAHA